MPDGKKDLVGSILSNFGIIFNCKIGKTEEAGRNEEFIELMKNFGVNGEKILDIVWFNGRHFNGKI